LKRRFYKQIVVFRKNISSLTSVFSKSEGWI
jgi:hypothetical protein